MTVFRLILRHRLLTILAFPLIWLEPVPRASGAGQKLVFTNPPATLFNAGRGRSKWIGCCNFG